MRLMFVVSVAVATLAGCSDPKKPSNANFEKAINAWIEKNPPCIALPRGDLPVAEEGEEKSDQAYLQRIDASPGTTPYAMEAKQKQRVPFEALVGAGLLTQKATTIKQKALFGGAETEKSAIEYSLTDAGRAALAKNPERSAWTLSKLCYGTSKVAEIVRYTEPADIMGMRVSQVNYRYQVTDLPAWAKDAKMLAAFPELKRDTATDLTAKAAVVLTNEGWVHERTMNN